MRFSNSVCSLSRHS